MNVSVLGAGGWGTTLAILISRNGHKVALWEYFPEYAITLKKYRENFYYLPKVNIPKSIKITNDLENAVSNKDVILITTPTQFIRESFSTLRNFDFGNAIMISASKGIENNSLMLVSEIILDIFKKVRKNKVASLSGPSHAEEVSRKIPTTVVCASSNIEVSKLAQKVFSNNYFRVYNWRCSKKCNCNSSRNFRWSWFWR